MCGIVGYVGQRSAQEVLLAGLEKLEYRGYDSAGISIQTEGTLESTRAVGNLARLKEALENELLADGARFTSETDVEVIAHLIALDQAVLVEIEGDQVRDHLDLDEYG